MLLLAEYSDKAEGEKWGEKHADLIKSCPINGYPYTYLSSAGAKKLGSVQYYEPVWSIQDYIDKI